jgi:metal-sulfur cluster biosynthetic enzyme
VTLEDAVWQALEDVEDPELPVPITDVGLVRRLDVTGGSVRVGITYTSLACPCMEMLREDVHDALASVPGVASVEVDDVLEPWSRADITPDGRAMLRAIAVV